MKNLALKVLILAMTLQSCFADEGALSSVKTMAQRYCDSELHGDGIARGRMIDPKKAARVEVGKDKLPMLAQFYDPMNDIIVVISGCSVGTSYVDDDNAFVTINSSRVALTQVLLTSSGLLRRR